jgi:Ca2+:H+ antiporter
MAKRILWCSLALAPIAYGVHKAGGGDVLVFILSAASLIPLAWLIGEATEHAAHHTGPGVGGFLNASFGNAPEVIIALFAVSEGLPEVVRGSLTGSVIGNLLLVLGFSLALGGRGELDRWSGLVSLALVMFAGLLLLIPAVPSWSGDPERHSLAVVSLPVSIVLVLVYVGVTRYTLRRHTEMHHTSDDPAAMQAWSFRRALVALGIATAVTAVVAEMLTSTIDTFAEEVGLSDFFVAAVIVAIVGNAAEHGGAVVVAARGKLKLAAEIALSSSAQVAVAVIPAVQILSWAVSPALPLSFRPIEMAALLGSTVFVSLVLWGGRSSRARGAALIGAYVAVATAFYIAGDRE